MMRPGLDQKRAPAEPYSWMRGIPNPMAAPYIAPPSGDLDFLLAQVARALQLTSEQYRLAEEHYKAVARWLAATGSPLAPYQPWIYPQGSMALETTVRPLGRDEYDLDLVCEMQPTGMPAIWVYDNVFERLKANGQYAPIVEKKNRCVRLNYAHNFHLDIIPAEPDRSRNGGAIWVPDRKLRDWTPSNPKGYVAWFTNRTQTALAELRKKVDPLPRPTPSDEKPALTIAVQLMKRRRDVLLDEDVAPRSIVLTTLAAEYYRGTDCVLTALGQVVAGIQQRIRIAHPRRIIVCNPTNTDEMFCESFDGPGRYEAFKSFIDQLQQDVEELSIAQGIPNLQRLLAEKFGEEPTARAIESYGIMLKSKRDTGTLSFTGAGAGGLSIVTPAPGPSRIVPANRYYGGDGGE